jgi:hypothetical protein
VSSAVLAVGRSLGPFLVAANLVGIALLARRDRLRAVVTGLRRRSSLGWVALLLAAVVAGAVWAAAVMPRPGFSIGDTIDRLPGAWRQLPAESAQTVGVFGWLDAHLPLVGYGIWFAVLLALIAVAVRRGGVAAAWRLGLLVVGALALTLFVAAGVLGAIHFSMQARYVMPVTLGVVLAAGELADRAREPRGLGLATAIVGACAVVHVVAVWANLRRYAVGTGGPRWFLGHEQWTPPGGSLGWLLLAVTGAVLAGAALVVRIRPPAAGVGQALGS